MLIRVFAETRILQCTWNLWLQRTTCVRFSRAIWRPCSLDGHSGKAGVCARGEWARPEWRDDALECVRRDRTTGREADVRHLRGPPRAGHRDELQRALDERAALLEDERACLELVGDAIDDAMRLHVFHVVRADKAHRAVRTARDVRIAIGVRRRRGIRRRSADVTRVGDDVAPPRRARRQREGEDGGAGDTCNMHLKRVAASQ